MRLFSVLLCLLIAGCQGCATLKYKKSDWDAGGDRDAAYAQRLMRSTVEIFMVGSALVPNLGGKEGEPKLLPFRFHPQGTGTVIAKKGKGEKAESLVLTADHLCQVAQWETVKAPLSKDVTVEVPVLGMRIDVWDIDMNKHDAEIVYQDPEHDLCVVKVAGDAGEVMPVATELPPVGAMVTNIGAPRDNFQYHMAIAADGRYCGLQLGGKDNKSLYEMFSNPSSPGGSGGGIYYHGKLVGVLVMIETYHGHISFGVPLPFVQAAIAEGKKAWLGQPSTKTNAGK